MGIVIGIVAGATLVSLPFAAVGITALAVHQFRRKGFKLRLGD